MKQTGNFLTVHILEMLELKGYLTEPLIDFLRVCQWLTKPNFEESFTSGSSVSKYAFLNLTNTK